MRGFLWRWLIATGILLALARFTYLVEVLSPWRALIAAAVIGLCNALVAPLVALARIVSYPLNYITFGLFSLAVSLFVNAVIVWFAGSGRVSGFEVRGAAGAAAVALILSLANALLSAGARKRRE